MTDGNAFCLRHFSLVTLESGDGRVDVFYMFLARKNWSLSTLELKIQSCRVGYCCPNLAIFQQGFLKFFYLVVSNDHP